MAARILIVYFISLIICTSCFPMDRVKREASSSQITCPFDRGTKAADCSSLGLERFPTERLYGGLKELDMSDNNVVQFQGLESLKRLKTLRLQRNNITNLKDLFANLPSWIDHVDLSGNIIKHINEDDIKCGLRLKELILEVEEVHSAAPFQCLDRLSHLDLTLHKEELNDTLLHGLKLRTVSLTLTNAKELPKKIFLNLSPHIESITLTAPNLEIIEHRLSSLAKLRTVYLDLPNVDVLPKDLLCGSMVEVARRLNISNSIMGPLEAMLESLDQNCLFQTVEIRNVYRIPEGFFNNITTLERVRLRNVTEMPYDMFSHMFRLEELDLSLNNMSSIPHGWLDPLQVVTTLNISHNKLGNLNESAFRNINNLVNLDLSSNRLYSIDSKTFQPFRTSLKMANLSYNNFGELPSGLFSGMLSLEHLLLINTSLRHIPHDSFYQVSSLTVLEAQNNHLTQIESNYFHGLNSLRKLDLSYNQIAEIGGAAFTHMEDLQEVNLEGNNLQRLPQNLFNENYVLERVNMKDNVLHCDCQAYNLKLHMQEFSPELDTNLVCATPENLHGVSISDLTEDVCITTTEEPEILTTLKSTTKRPEATTTVSEITTKDTTTSVDMTTSPILLDAITTERSTLPEDTTTKELMTTAMVWPDESNHKATTDLGHTSASTTMSLIDETTADSVIYPDWPDGSVANSTTAIVDTTNSSNVIAIEDGINLNDNTTPGNVDITSGHRTDKRIDSSGTTLRTVTLSLAGSTSDFADDMTTAAVAGDNMADINPGITNSTTGNGTGENKTLEDSFMAVDDLPASFTNPPAGGTSTVDYITGSTNGTNSSAGGIDTTRNEKYSTTEESNLLISGVNQTSERDPKSDAKFDYITVETPTGYNETKILENDIIISEELTTAKDAASETIDYDSLQTTNGSTSGNVSDSLLVDNGVQQAPLSTPTPYDVTSFAELGGNETTDLVGVSSGKHSTATDETLFAIAARDGLSSTAIGYSSDNAANDTSVVIDDGSDTATSDMPVTIDGMVIATDDSSGATTKDAPIAMGEMVTKASDFSDITTASDTEPLIAVNETSTKPSDVSDTAASDPSTAALDGQLDQNFAEVTTDTGNPTTNKGSLVRVITLGDDFVHEARDKNATGDDISASSSEGDQTESILHTQTITGSTESILDESSGDIEIYVKPNFQESTPTDNKYLYGDPRQDATKDVSVRPVRIPESAHKILGILLWVLVILLVVANIILIAFFAKKLEGWLYKRSYIVNKTTKLY